jgi:RHS repeat-associated protein
MRLLTPIFIFIFSFLGYSSDVLWNVRLESSAIYGGNLMVEDGDFGQLISGNFVDVGPKTFSYVRLGMSEVPGMTFTTGKVYYRLKLSVSAYSNTGVLQSPTVSYLEASYSSLGSDLSIDAEDLRLLGVHKFSVTVDEIFVSSNGTNYSSLPNGSSLPNYMYLEAGFSAERYYALNTTQVPLASHNYITYNPLTGAADRLYNQGITATTSSTDELEISWNYVEGAEYYDLEWTWVDNYNGSSLSGPVRPRSGLPVDDPVVLTDQDFQRNSTRIRTGSQSYRIPQVFAKGYLVYRVRGVGRWLNDLSKDKYGLWSGTTIPTIPESLHTYVGDWQTGSNGVITIGSEHEGLKNWQYDATYAEGGKKKEVAQYFDGSLRPRQVVTRLNSDNHSVVGETVYDNEGRGVIQILPVPQTNPSLQYYEDLNKNVSGIPYSYEDFDLESTNVSDCAPALSGSLGTGSGASKYYSPGGHAGETDWQQYVPDAQGYPFTQVEYTPDNTGRIRNQSGVGLDHQIGSGHQTIYYYTQPSQEELNRLFGYKVGYKQRYKKNMVVDANGQVSVSYLDASGKVIATALSGNKPGDSGSDFPLKGLASEEHSSSHSTITIDILGKLNPTDPNTANDNNELMITGRFGGQYDGLKSGTQIAVTSSGAYNFLYEAQTSYFTAACGADGINYPFVYDLKLSLKNDCGDEKFEAFYPAVGEQDFASTVTDFVSIAEPETLEAGSWTVYKEITVNEASLQAYKEHYLNPVTGCIEGPSAFYDAIEADCDSMSCESCMEELGSWSAYLAQAELDLGHPVANPSNEYTAILDVYNQLREQCIAPCRVLTSCDVYLQSMLGDLRPQGQYGGSPGDGLSIFTIGGQLTKLHINGTTTVCNWKVPDSPYLDANGNQSYIPVTITGYDQSGLPIYSPQIDNPTGNLITLNGSLFVKPEHLSNASDFRSYFESSWSSVFLPYHPEYTMYKYATEICSNALPLSATLGGSSASFLVSSDVFDNLVLNQAMTFQEANGLETTLDGLDFYTVDLLDPLGTYGGLYENDPYFRQDYPVHEWITNNQVGIWVFPVADATDLKNNLMRDALLDYKDGMSMLSYAVKTVLPNATVPNNVTWTTILGSWPTHQDMIWQTYKSYYMGYKLRINQFLMDVYGFMNHKTTSIAIPGGSLPISVGQFNGAIGSGNVNTGVFPSFSTNGYFMPAFWMVCNTYTTTHSGSIPGGGMWSMPYTPPIYFRGSEYNSKQIRITRINALYDPAVGEADVISEMGGGADYQAWQSTGLCPLTLDFERFLNSQGVSGALATSGSTQTIGTFTPDMFTALTGLSPLSANPVMNITATAGSSLTLQFSYGAGINQTFTIPQFDPNLHWSNYGPGGWQIYEVSHSFPMAGTNNVKVLIRAGTSSGSQEYVVIYQSPIDLNGCQAEYSSGAGDLDPECQRDEQFEGAFLGLMQQLMEVHDVSASPSVPFFYSTTPVDITNYPAYANSVLPSYLGFPAGTPVYWSVSPGGGLFNFQLTCGSYSIRFAVTSQTVGGVTTPSSTFSGELLSVTSFSLSGNTFHFGGFEEAVSSTTSSYFLYSGSFSLTNNTIPQELDLSCDCGETQSPEELLQAYLNYLYTHPSIPCGSQPAELLAIKDYLPFTNPAIYQVSTGGSTRIIRHAEYGTPCVDGDIPGACDFVFSNSKEYASVSHVVIGPSGISFTGHYEGGGTTPLTMSSSCFKLPECEECLPEPLEPVSCSSAHAAYLSAMNSRFTFTDPDEQDIFDTEYLLSEDAFCENSFAYISTAYDGYLQGMGITSVMDLHYLSLAQFGNTPLGYSNGKLLTALSAYLSYIGSSTPGASSMSWNTYITSVYLVENTVCPAVSPAPSFPSGPFEEAPCDQWEAFCASVNQQNQYELYIAQVGAKFVSDYLSAALSSLEERFTESHADKEYHYTLYYYDRAGNLIQTVPPQGVDRLDIGEPGVMSYAGMNQVRANDADETEDVSTSTSERQAPEHTMETVYHYNSLNQLVYQNTPDGGVSRFAYDGLGRLVLSQNANQALGTGPKRFSYTKYDALGRVVEAGELTANGSYSINEKGGLDVSGVEITDPAQGLNHPSFPWNLVSGASGFKEVTRTIYDELKQSGAAITVPMLSGPAVSVATLFADYDKLNTRNRIVGIIYQETYNLSLSTYNNATFYDYDVHGNVKELIQVNMDQALLDLNHHIKHVNYQYDLVSGNVNKVIYQKGYPDQFIHRYTYDDDNRITHAETSRDDFYYEKDAKYFYYDHGPLARAEIGDKKVTASDYAYTIQGWLKAVNGEEIKAVNTSMGSDGISGLNKYAGRDVYGYSLHYFAGDYNSSNTAMLNYSSDNASMDAGYSLYNGNIREMYTVLSDKLEAPLKSHQTVYQYDQLNRIKEMNGTYKSMSGGTVLDEVSGYKSKYSFDANGNILTMQNWSATIENMAQPTPLPNPIDDLSYTYLKRDAAGTYSPGAYENIDVVTGQRIDASNRLSRVDDEGDSDPEEYGDILDQDLNNYDYDEIGQLTQDTKEGITNISWTVTNKVKEVQKSNEEVIHFDYDALGHRISKQVLRQDGSYEKTFYILDAQGNVMSTYKRYSTEGSPVLVLSDRNIYGSSRVGVEDVHMELAQQAVSSANTGMEPVPGTTQLFNSGETSLGSTWTRQSSCSTAVVMSNSGGMLQITDVCPTQYDFMQPTEIGREYRFEADFDVSQASSLFITFLAQSPGCLPPAVYGQNLVVTTGHFSYTFTATTDCSRISIRNYGSSSNGGTFKIDNISFLRGSMNVVTVSNQVGDKQYELANHLGNVLNVVTDRKLRQAPADETVFEDRFNTPGDLLGWHYDPVLAQEPVPSGYSLTNPSGKLVVNPGSASSYGSVIKSVQFLQGVHYTLSFDAVLSTNQGAVLAGSSSGTLLIADFLTTGSHSFNFVGDGSFGYIAFLMLPNVVYQYDNIKLVANDVQTVTADVKTYSDYYPYGMQLPKRHGEDVYRYAFNGKEKDDELKGSGNSYDFGARMYDPRIGRWLKPDPLEYLAPSLSPYVFAANSPIVLIDPDGEKEKPYEKGKSKPVTEVKNTATPAYIYNKTGTVTGYDPNAANAYNCHSYAWHKSVGDGRDLVGNNDPNLPKWDNDPSDDINEQNARQLHKDVRNKVGDRVIYYQDVNGDGTWQDGEPIAHSAIVSEVDKQGNTVAVTGKMGQAGISTNHPGAPGYYETDNGEATGNKLSRAYLRVGSNIQKVGAVTFDSNGARPVKDDNGKTKYLIIQDINTGKAYGVTRDSKGLYHFYPSSKENSKPTTKKTK